MYLALFSDGLDSLRALHTLDVSHNQLISCQGLRDVVTIQRLEMSHNHLPAIDGIVSLGLLQHLDVSSNNIMEVGLIFRQKVPRFDLHWASRLFCVI